MIGYRRHGHSEVDDPTVTQPLALQSESRHHPPLWELYAEDAGMEDEAQARATEVKADYDAGQKRAGSITKKPTMRDLPNYWDGYFGGRHKASTKRKQAVRARN